MIRDLGFLLVGILFGAALSYITWLRQFRKQQRQSVVEETAKALGMYFDDATNPERKAEIQKIHAKAGESRHVNMRPETSSTLIAHEILVRAMFGEFEEMEIRRLTSMFPRRDDDPRVDFVDEASIFLKRLLDKV